MKKEIFPRVGSAEREANLHLVWTLGWAFVAFGLSVITVFQL